MKFTLSWLKDHLDTTATVDEITYALTDLGLEVEGVENPTQKDPEFEVHSGADSAAVTDTSGHEAILQDFIDAVRDARDPAVPAASGRLATELVLRIYENKI